jgi:hypothetical protein
MQEVTFSQQFVLSGPAGPQAVSWAPSLKGEVYAMPLLDTWNYVESVSIPSLPLADAPHKFLLNGSMLTSIQQVCSSATCIIT